MKISWLRVARYGAAIGGAISPAIPAAEAMAERIIGTTGAEKRAAVMATVQQSVQAVNEITGRTLMDTPKIAMITGQIIDLQVALHEAIAEAMAFQAGPHGGPLPPAA